MIKYDHGAYVSPSEGEFKGQEFKIIPKSTFSCKSKDLLIGIGLIIIGVLPGAVYIGNKSFKHGADCFENEEFNTMVRAGIIHASPDEKL